MVEDAESPRVDARFDLTQPVIAGFSNARSDDLDESEPLSVHRPATNVTLDCYYHPAKRQLRHQRYVPGYDLYSLGCVLLEIGLWQPIDAQLELDERTDTDAAAFETMERIKLLAGDRLDG